MDVLAERDRAHLAEVSIADGASLAGNERCQLCQYRPETARTARQVSDFFIDRVALAQCYIALILRYRVPCDVRPRLRHAVRKLLLLGAHVRQSRFRELFRIA